MILERHRGAIGDWWFEAEPFADPAGRVAFAELMTQLAAAAPIFEDAELLFADRLTFGGWLADRNGTRRRVDEIGSRSIVLPGTASGLVGSAMEVVDSVAREAGEFLYPIDMEVTGTGVLIEADGSRFSGPDIVWLEARTLGHHIVSVNVQSDAFMRWSLSGQEQHKIWEVNAPRLEWSLASVAAALGMTTRNVSSTDFAHIEGLQLLNIRDIDGDIIPME